MLCPTADAVTARTHVFAQAVLAITRSIATDHIAEGIRCNCICPGRIHTEFVDNFVKLNYPGLPGWQVRVEKVGRRVLIYACLPCLTA